MSNCNGFYHQHLQMQSGNERLCRWPPPSKPPLLYCRVILCHLTISWWVLTTTFNCMISASVAVKLCHHTGSRLIELVRFLQSTLIQLLSILICRTNLSVASSNSTLLLYKLSLDIGIAYDGCRFEPLFLDAFPFVLCAFS